MTEHGYALYDWRTRRRLAISREQIEANGNLAVNAIVALETNVPHLIHDEAKWDEDFEQLFSTLADLSEPPIIPERD